MAVTQRQEAEIPPAQPGELPWHHWLRLGAGGLVSDMRDRRRDPTLAKRPSVRALDPRVHRPVFVIGAPRSGTTFLGGCVGRLPEVSYHLEPRLTKAAISRVYHESWSERRSSALFRLSYSSLILAGLHGGRRFAEKTPENSFVVPFLAATFPGAQFVHIIRDGRDAAVSHAEKPWLTADAARTGVRNHGGQLRGPSPRWWVEQDRREEFTAVSDVVRTAWCWRRFTEAALDGLATLPSGSAFEVRYEAVVADPMATAEALAGFLGTSQAGLDALRAGLARARPESAGRWRTALDPADMPGVDREIGPLLARLGYR
jgi:Sulfotransferase family